MPIIVDIDRQARRVNAKCEGMITMDDVMNYQTDVWVRGAVSGFDGLFDSRDGDFSQINMTDLIPVSTNAIQVDKHVPFRTKMAMVIKTDEQQKLAEFYKAMVDLQLDDQRETKIFNSFEQAMDWLDE